MKGTVQQDKARCREEFTNVTNYNHNFRIEFVKFQNTFKRYFLFLGFNALVYHYKTVLNYKLMVSFRLQQWHILVFSINENHFTTSSWAFVAKEQNINRCCGLYPFK